MRIIFEKPKKKRKRKPECSKILLVAISALALIVAITSIVATFVLQDSTPLIYLIPAVFAELATATAFYYWKAKAENAIKLGILDKTDLLDYESETIDEEGADLPEDVKGK